MKLRSQIDDKYKWDIGFGTKEEIEKAFEDFQYLIDTLPKYNGKFEDKEMFFEYFLGYEEQNKNIARLMFYIFNAVSVDNSNVEIIKLQDRYSIMASEYDKATSFINPQLSKLPIDYLEELLLDPRSKNIQNTIKNIIRNKPHELDENVSKVLSMVNNSFSDTNAIFDIIADSEMEFEDAIDAKGKHHEMNETAYRKFITTEDRQLRKTAYASLVNGYKKFNKTFSELYIKSFKSDNDNVSLYKHKDLLEMRLFDEEVPREVFEKNIENVNKNLDLLKDFIKILKKESGLKDFSNYDLQVKEKIGGKISIEEAQNIMLSALAPLGQEYIDKVKYKLADKSIDYMPNKNKRALAYSSNLYYCKTLILLNWNYDFDSLTTLCHEMGHAVNSEFYQQTQPKENGDTTIFAAEIASTTNELLLNQYMLQNSKNKEKKQHLKSLLTLVRSAIFNQTLLSEFELFAHTMIENQTPISYMDLNEKYAELDKKYYGSIIKSSPDHKYMWSRIDHMFTPYYVFSYSTGLITAINIVINILNDPSYANQYIQFLKNGTEKPAVNILKEIGIDLTTDEPFDRAFNFIREQLDIYKSIK